MFERAKALLNRTKQAPSTSIGVVARNFGNSSRFDPQRQFTGITYKAIDQIGQSLSSYEMQVKRRSGEAVASHPLYVLFNDPNPRQSASDFIHLYGMLYQIFGETFWYKVKGERTGRIMELYLLPPDKMELKVDKGELIGYVLHKSNGQQVPFEVDEILHDKRPNPFNEWRGLSVLEKAALYIDTELATTNFTLNYINNSASPSGIVTLPAMDKPAFDLFVSQWRENYEGPKNAGKTGFIRKTTKDVEVGFTAIGSTLKDIDAKVVRDMSKDDVLMMLGVPKPLLGLTDESGFGRGNVETLNYIFATQTVEPLMRRLDRIYETLGAEMNSGQPIDVSHASIIPEDKDYKLSLAEKATDKWLTRNEAREMFGYEAIDGGDVIVERPAVPAAAKSASKVVRVALKPKVSKAEQVRKIAEEQEAFRSKLVDTNELYMKKFKREFSKQLARQGAEVVGKINAASKAFDDFLFTIKDETEVIAEALLPIMLELMDAQSEDVANFITGELMTLPPELRTSVEQRIKTIVGVFNQDTIKALEKTLTEGQTAGESLDKLAKRVTDVYADAEGYRAERIARTETLRASNLTAEEVYKQNGYSTVEWFTNPSACEFCATFEGRQKSIGSDFTKVGDVVTGTDGSQLRIEYDDIGSPPLHPNCTCTLVPVAA